MTEISARLRVASLAAEGAPRSNGGRGRPSPSIHPHPAGPVALIIEVRHADWRIAAVELGLRQLARREARHNRQQRQVFASLRAAAAELEQMFGDRISAISIAVPAATAGRRIVAAAPFGWESVDMTEAVPESLRDRPILLDNDATLAGLAEARRGAARTAQLALYLTIEVGLGGALLHNGRPIAGGSGAGGEFGHLPFGNQRRRCPCGARGCWETEIDGRALARLLHCSTRDPRSFAERTIERARSRPGAERRSVEKAAARFGRGIGALVNALDPEVVILGGVGAGYLSCAQRPLRKGYEAGLMAFRRAAPPALEPAAFPDHGTLLGAAEAAFDRILTPGGLESWRGSRDLSASAS